MLAALALGTALAASASAQTVGVIKLVTTPTDPCFSASSVGTMFAATEYYGNDFGMLAIGDANFVRNNARLPGCSPDTEARPDFGAGLAATNLDTLCANLGYRGYPGLDMTFPEVISGHNYKLQLIIHEPHYAFPNTGKRVMDITTATGVLLANGLDPVALGAGATNNAVVVLSYTFTSDGVPLEVLISQTAGGADANMVLNALTLEDLTPGPVAPKVVAAPQSTTNFVGRPASIYGTAIGPSPLAYQWRAGAANSGVYTNVIDDGVSVSGSGTPSLNFASLSLANQGDYVMVITNLFGSVTSTVATVTTLPIPGPIANSGYTSYLMTNYNPVAYWRLSEQPGCRLLYDSSAYMHDGVMTAYPTLGVPGPKAPPFPGFEANHTAMGLPGSTNTSYGMRATSPLHLDQFTTNNATMLAWVKPYANQYGGAALFFSRVNTGVNNVNNNGLAFNTYPMSDGDMEIGYCWNGYDYSIHSGLEVPHNIWSLVAVVITPTNATFYVYNTNALLTFSTPALHTGATGGTTAMTVPEQWNGPTFIGYDTFDYRRTFNGAIAEAAVLPVALSSGEVLNLYGTAMGITGFPPQITTQPRGGSVGIGATKTLSVTVNGTAPFSYQWQARAVGGGVFTNLTDLLNVSGSIANPLTITSFGTANVGDYRVVVTNSYGSTTSSVATLQLNNPTPDNSYSYAIFTNSPLACWRLNEAPGSANLLDSSPTGGFDATPLASATLGVAGPRPLPFPGFETANTCLQLGYGSNDGYATFPPLNLNSPTSPTSVKSLTLTAWIYPNDYQQAQTGILFLKGTGDGGLNYSGSFTDANGHAVLGYTWNGGNGNWNTGLQPPPNMWSFVALVVTATDASMYLFNADGLSMAYLVNNNATTPFLQPGAIGADTHFVNWGGYTGIFNGYIDEVSVFTSALSGSLLETLYGKAVGISAFPVVVSQQPANAAVVPGGSASFKVSALGTSLSYQWQARPFSGGTFTNLIDGGSISGSQTATLSINNASAANVAQYQVIVANPMPSSVTSQPVRLVLVSTAPPGLIGQWLTGSQDLADKSGFTPAGTHDGTMIGTGLGSSSWAPADVPAGFSGASLSLDGTCAVLITNTATVDAGYLPTFDYSIAHRFTVSFWAKGFPPHGWHPIVTKGGENNLGWQVRADNNGVGANPTFTLRGVMGNNDGADGAPVNLNDGQWHHYAGTWDSALGVRHLYIDGVPELNLYGDFGSTSAIGDVSAMAVDAGHHLELGAIEALNNPPNWFAGQFFDVRVYNYALGPGEIQALVNPPAAGAVALCLNSTNGIPVGQTEVLTVLIPADANRAQPVNVWITNNAPAVAAIQGATGNVLAVTFPSGAPNFQSFTLDAVGAGRIQLTAGTDSGLASSALADTAVIAPRMIGQWISGTADLLDKSGFKPGTHDGTAVATYLGDTTPIFVADVPPGFSGQSLKLNGGYAVAINNSCSLNYEGVYQPTFDDEIAEAFSVSFWAKGTYIPGWQPWVGKRGESSFGWKVRAHGGDHCPTFTMRMTSSLSGDNDDPFNSSTRVDGNYGLTWHHYTATYDSVAGVRKLYVDGKLDLTVPNDFGPYGLAKPNYLTIGGLDNDANASSGPTFGNFLTGQMFDVRMYNYALDGGEVQALAHPSATALAAAADAVVIDQGSLGTVSVSLPQGANATQPVTVWVTNVNPALVSIAGATGNVFALTFPAGGRPSETLTLTGLSDGRAQVAFGANGFTPASATVEILAPIHLVGHWFAGHTNLADHSGFTSSGTHDGQIVGSTPANLSFSTDVPAGFAGQSLKLNNSANAPSVAVLITNTCTYDNSYAPTFDDAIAMKFTISFWAKMSATYGQQWVPFITKRGENYMGFKVRRHGGDNTETFTLRGTYLQGAIDDPAGSVNINSAGVWRHFAAVWDGYSGTRKIYVNGVLDPSINLTNDFGPFMLARDHHLVVGAGENSTIFGPMVLSEGLDSNTGFNGLLYDLRIYNYPLSAAEVQTVMTPVRTSVLPSAPGSIHLSWPVASAIGYVLQTSPDLVHWTNAPLAVTSVGGQNTVTDTVGTGTLFYRLYLP